VRRPPAFAVFDTTGRAFVQLGKAFSVGSKEEVAKSLMAYFGPCTLDGDTLSVIVESSNMPGYVGSTQTRKFSLDWRHIAARHARRVPGGLQPRPLTPAILNLSFETWS